MKTPEEARKAWIEALRSGEYKQGKEYLHRGDRFCCLGVACELAIADGVEVRPGPYYVDSDITAYDGDARVLPDPVLDWLGLDTSEGGYTARNSRHTSLAKRNDSGVPFSKIADIIESEPKGLLA